jgi:catechol 2,3-dioxygenase-like lactoylglutathione lyase family enzyme
MPDAGFTHIALPVRSLDASIGFYFRYAAMQVVHRRPGVAWISDCSRPFAIVLMECRTVEHPLLAPAHLGIAVSSRAEVDRLCALAHSEGCLVSDAEDAGPPLGYWALICDPDNHAVEIAHGQNMGIAINRAAQYAY